MEQSASPTCSRLAITNGLQPRTLTLMGCSWLAPTPSFRLSLAPCTVVALVHALFLERWAPHAWQWRSLDTWPRIFERKTPPWVCSSRIKWHSIACSRRMMARHKIIYSFRVTPCDTDSSQLFAFSKILKPSFCIHLTQSEILCYSKVL